MNQTSTIWVSILALLAMIGVIRNQKLRDLQDESGSPSELAENPSLSRQSSLGDVTSRVDDLLGMFKESSFQTGKSREDAIRRGKLADLSVRELVAVIERLSEDSQASLGMRQDLVTTALKLLASKSPDKALALVLELRSKNEFPLPQLDLVTARALQNLAGSNPFSAADWLTRHFDQEGNGSVKAAIVTAAAQSDFKGALSLATMLKFDLEDRSDRYFFFGSLGAGVSLSSIEDVLPVVRELEDGEAMIVFQAMGKLAFGENFEEASQWFDQSALDARTKEMLLLGVKFWTIQENPGQWLDWVSTHDELLSQSEYIPVQVGQMINEWANSDFVAAGEWLQRQEEGALKIEGSTRYIGVILGHEPVAAAAWLQEIPASHPSHERLVNQVYHFLQGHDAVAAAAFAEKYHLQDELD